MKYLPAYVCALILAAVPAIAQKGSANRQNAIVPGGAGQDHMAREVRHELVMLPYYGVFDNLAYSVNGSDVTLYGQVVNPVLRSDAGNVVKRIEGVRRVDNQIKVLPLSPMDDQLRRAEFRAIYSEAQLNRYALQAVPPIHIIVDNGHVTLVGAVATAADKNIAGLRANGVPGVFGVDNQLQVRP